MRIQYCWLSGLVLGLALLAPASTAQTPPTCNDHFTKSTTLSQSVADAYAAMSAKDAAKQAALLPALETQLNALPATEIKAEVCATHINAYTTYQFNDLTALRSRGLATGFPAELPLVKQPDLNHAVLAYAVGWIKYEQGAWDAALAAFTKGLAMFPHDVNLQQEYVATLLQLKRYKDVVTYTDKMLTDANGMDDENRAKTYHARGVALYASADNAAALDALAAALKYQNTDEIQATQKVILDAQAKAKPN